VSEGAVLAQQLTREVRQVLLANLVKLSVAKPLGAAGAGSGPSLDVAGGVMVLALLVFGYAVRAVTALVLEVDGVGVLARAAGDFPNPRRDAVDLLEVSEGESDAALEAGGWVRLLR
jgi:hypothetical protein